MSTVPKSGTTIDQAIDIDSATFANALSNNSIDGGFGFKDSVQSTLSFQLGKEQKIKVKIGQGVRVNVCTSKHSMTNNHHL